MDFIIKIIFSFFAILPLKILHKLGNLLGIIFFLFAKKAKKITLNNIKQTNLVKEKNLNNFAINVSKETIKSGLEVCIACIRSPQYIVSLFKNIYGWELVEEAIKNKNGILFLTPHIGSYDLAGRYISEKLPFNIIAMYKEPNLKFLKKIIQTGRTRNKGISVPTSISGIRLIFKALKNKQATIILPDQVPKNGEGILVPFFNKDAYTMTLIYKLANINDVTTLFYVGERLKNGKGFNLHIIKFQGNLTKNKQKDTLLINYNLEEIIKKFPEQYLFSYNRYKMP